MKKKILIVIGVLIVLGSLTYLVSGKKEKVQLSDNNATVETANNMETVRAIFTQDSEDISLILNYAKDKDFFKNQNLDLELVPVKGNTTKALLAGGGELVLAGLTRPLSDYFNNAEPRLLANLFRSFTYYGVSRFPVDEIDKIKKVVVNAASGETKAVAIVALKNLGVDVANVEYIVAPTNEARLAILEKEEADFTIVNSEAAIYNSKIGEKYVILEVEQFLSDAPFLRTLYSSEEVITQKSDLISRSVAAIYAVQKSIADNKEDYVQYMIQEKDIPAERAEKLYARFISFRQGVDFVPTVESLVELAEIAKQEEVDNPNRSLEEFISSQFAKEVVDGQ